MRSYETLRDFRRDFPELADEVFADSNLQKPQDESTPLKEFYGGNFHVVDEGDLIPFEVAADFILHFTDYVMLIYINNNAGGPTYFFKKEHYESLTKGTGESSSTEVDENPED